METSNARKTRPRPPQIDHDKLRSAICRLNHDTVGHMLDDAIELLPSSKLAKLVGRYLDIANLQPTPHSSAGLLAEVKAFESASLAGDFYESFNVNSKNYREVSGGTRAWIAECRRLLDRCVKDVDRGGSHDVCQSFETLFALLQHIDECLDDVVFFADEGGSWQVGVDWQNVLPAWFKCIPGTVEPHVYAQRVIAIVDGFAKHDRDKFLAVAGRTASSAQRKALAESTSWKRVRGS